MDIPHEHTASCIQPDGSYCAELERAIGIPAGNRARWVKHELPVDPFILDAGGYEDQDEWLEPHGEWFFDDEEPEVRL